MTLLKRLLLLAVLALASIGQKTVAQDFAMKTNTLYWLAGGTINGGIEMAMNRKFTLELFGAYNPWNFKDDKKMHLWLAQPELKYWLCEKFEGHFFGLHAHGGQYFGGFNKWRYDGYLVGGGLSYGYNWILSPHWNFEAEIGVGFTHLWYDQSENVPCVKCKRKHHKNVVTPTRASLSFIYIF